ncbi:MAG: TonB-dependent receptor plug domain-containing protein [Planctomycetes bacterium]|nr:TonB-dependent receptor plug domain-containing protein [Planctomycetota bacterium]
MDARENELNGGGVYRKWAVLLIIMVLLTFVTDGLGADDVGLVKNEQRLDDVSSKLDALDNERARLLEEKENLQILLWGETEGEDDDDEFFDMSIVDLMQVEIAPVGTLTRTAGPRYVPSAVTKITQEQISMSGAHSLNELLEIYVPNLQFARQHWEGSHLGMRGIINDRDDKYLMLVNGKVMNERTHFGALSERDLVTLGDIHHIDVIRGPGSAIYGPGAVAMVINIVTDSGLTFQGTEITTKIGVIEEFASMEVKHGLAISKDSGLLIYFGVDKYVGSDSKWSPWVFGNSFTSKGGVWNGDWWDTGAEVPGNYYVQSGSPVQFSINDDGEAFRRQPRVKLHAQYNKGNFETWVRWTKGGQNFTNPSGVVKSTADGGWANWWGGWAVNWQPAAEDLVASGVGYSQLTGYAGYKQELSETLTIDYAASYDSFSYTRQDWARNINDDTEDEYYAKILARWTPNEAHSLAFGGETSYENWGSMGRPQFNVPINNTHWSTLTYSGMGEWQWNISDHLTSFVGGRVDRNTYTHNLYSPRAAFVWTPNERDTYKFMATKSVRMNNAEEMRNKHVTEGKHSRPEELENIEFRYESQCSEHLWFAMSAYRSKLDVISWDSAATLTQNVGVQKHWGLEGEITYKKDKVQVIASHGYTKLVDFKLNPGASTFLTAHPFGYGKDLANWSNHITKLYTQYDADAKLSFNASARIYWGTPGGADYANYLGLKEPGFNEAFKMSAFVNLGVQYKCSDDMTLRLDGTNLLGFIDYEYNSRMYSQDQFDNYRSTAPSFIFSLIYKFK